MTAQRAADGESRPLFRMSTNDFWLNLHHFLYVLGRVAAKMPDASRRAVAGAPADRAEGLEALAPAERATWSQAVVTYSTGLSRQDAVFDEPLIEAGNRLAGAADRASIEGLGSTPGYKGCSTASHRFTGRVGGRGIANRTSAGRTRSIRSWPRTAPRSSST